MKNNQIDSLVDLDKGSPFDKGYIKSSHFRSLEDDLSRFPYCEGDVKKKSDNTFGGWKVNLDRYHQAKILCSK